jgi:uncharacterized Zn-binding protein involved in type VI secretion
MGQPAAKQGDRITSVHVHLILPPGAPPPPTVPVPHPFTGVIDGNLSPDVNIQGLAAATVGSTATNTPRHVPIGGTFVIPPTDQAQILKGSGTVFINNKPAARSGDTAQTCSDPVPTPSGTVVAVSTVFIGG